MEPLKLIIWATDTTDAFDKFNRAVADLQGLNDELKCSWFRLLTETGSAVGYVLSENAEVVIFFGSLEAYVKADIQESDSIKEYMDRGVQ